MQRPDVRKNLRRGVYIVPTLFTILNIFFGFRSIVNSLRAREAMTAGRPDLAIAAFEVACVSLLIAAIFDTFDGLIARQLGATSEFGKEYDSLADVVTFGTAPAVLLYAWGDRKSTRLNSSHPSISYAVFCLKKKKVQVKTRELMTATRYAEAAHT